MTRLTLPTLVLLALAAHAHAAAPPVRPFAVKVVKDVAYRSGDDADPVKHKLDLYVPVGKKDFPVVFFIHGGTWKSGDKKLYAPLGELFARNGVGMVVTNYRLSPKVKHPAHAEDVAQAFAWTHANVEKYGGRVDRLFLCGHSAGGHLVALLATDESYLKAHKLGFANVKAVLALSGVYVIAPGLFAAAFGNDLDACRKASPLTHVNGKHPPFLIVYADKDYPLLGSLADQLCKALQKTKSDVEIVKMKGRDHVSIVRKMAEVDDPTAALLLGYVVKRSK